MNLEIYQVDAFTDRAFSGNPAGVCLTDTDLDDALMRNIAAEMAVSETAFLNLNTMRLRWFTPQVEVALCGHGTLATAHILKIRGEEPCFEPVSFSTLSGRLDASFDGRRINLSFPAANITMHHERTHPFMAALGIKATSILDIATFDQKQMFVLSSEQAVLDLAPDFNALQGIHGRGVVVTAKADRDVDFVSRYFAPWVGVNEDPVTGSAHCALASYWSEKLNKSKLLGYQASVRGGYVGVENQPSGRVILSGHAVTTLSGQLTI